MGTAKEVKIDVVRVELGAEDVRAALIDKALACVNQALRGQLINDRTQIIIEDCYNGKAVLIRRVQQPPSPAVSGGEIHVHGNSAN